MAKQTWNPGGRQVPELIMVAEDISLAGAANINLVGFNKNSPIQARVLDFWTIQKAAGPAASSTLQLRKGDGAGTEVFTAISNALAIGTIVDKTVTRVGTLDDAEFVISKNESLNIIAVASAGTHSARVCVLLEVIEK